MRRPNPEVYGEESSWHDNFTFGGSTAVITSELYAPKPKVPMFTDTYTGDNTVRNSFLKAGIDSGKLINHEPIDDSICAIGAGFASPFHCIGICYNPSVAEGEQENENAQIKDLLYPAGDGVTYGTGIINGFLFEGRNTSAYANYGDRAYGRKVNLYGTTITGYEYAPSGKFAEGTANQNGNFSLSPFVSYGTRSILFAIQVYVANNTDLPDSPTSAPACTWRSLENWKDNYSEHIITGARIRGCCFSSYNASTGDMTYYNTQGTSSNYRHPIGYGICQELEFYYGVGTHKMYNYALMNGNQDHDGAIVFFYPITGLYKMKDAGFPSSGNADMVGFMGMADIFGNYEYNASTSVWYQIPYSNDAYDALMRATATFGCPFTPKGIGSNLNIIFNQDFTDTDLCLPIITGNGICNGEYTRGNANITNPFYYLDSVWNYIPPMGFNIRFGDLQIDKVYLGDTLIDKVYLGDISL